MNDAVKEICLHAKAEYVECKHGKTVFVCVSCGEEIVEYEEGCGG